MTEEEKFVMAYGYSVNFITPKLIEYREITPNLVCEISFGKAPLTNKKMYGVTVVRHENGISYKTNLSRAFFSMDEVEAYINKLKEENCNGNN